MRSYEGLAYLLAARGMVSQIGPETGRTPRDGVAVWRSPHGSVRYVVFEHGVAWAAIQVMSSAPGVGHVANAFTHPRARRQGLGRTLVARARHDFPQLTFGTDRSDDGAGFVRGLGENPPSDHFVRFGEWHPSETSRNYAEGYREAGVSVYDAVPTGRQVKVVLPTGGLDEINTEADLHARVRQFREGTLAAFLVTGEVVGTGGDGEPLIQRIKVVGVLAPTDIVL
jgi:GNAT superfamily N-acetyltransferase